MDILQHHRRAAEITALAQLQVARLLRPGRSEGELEAAIDEVFAPGICAGGSAP